MSHNYNIQTKLLSDLSYEETRTRLREISSVRAPEGQEPVGDIQLLKPEFLDLLEDGTMIVSFPIHEWQCNGLGILQGGMQSYIMDCALGFLGFTSSGCNPVNSTDMTTNFLRSMNTSSASEVFVHARVVKLGRKMLYLEAKMFNTESKLIATATTHMLRP